ncbi:MAG: HEAT repeat domain-containing protein, partial [Limisphaerales bacterium]
AVDPLCETLNDGSNSVRAAAAESLGKIGEPRAQDALVPLLSDAEPAVRVAAISALGHLGNADTLFHLLPLLQDDDSEIRRVTSNALNEIDPGWRQSQQVQDLLEALGITDLSVSSSEGVLRLKGDSDLPTLHMVGGAGDIEEDTEQDASLKPLFTELESHDPTVRFKAAKDLGRTGNPNACPALERALNDEVPPVRRAAAEALAALSWQPSDPSLPALQGIIVQDWAKVISLGESAVEPLIRALSQFDSLSQKNAAIALGEIGSSLATDALLQALESVDMGVRKAAVEALAKIGDVRAVEGLMQARNDSLKPVRDAAELALKQLGQL